MSLRERIRTAVAEGDMESLEAVIAESRRSVRHLLSLAYSTDERIRNIAAKGVGLAANHHPKLVKEAARRLVWAMNDESGTYAVQAPAVLHEIAKVRSMLLVPMVPDISRLTSDPGLRDGLSATLKTIAERCPGEVGRKMSIQLNKNVEGGGSCGRRR